MINVDLPWNPAKLEQRIARAWRKNQTRSVSVVNLVTENSIEHSILHLLGQKQALADGVARRRRRSRRAEDALGPRRLHRAHAGDDGDARADFGAPRLAEEAFVADLVGRLGDAALLIEARADDAGGHSLLAVLDLEPDGIASERARGAGALPIEFVDKATWLSMRRLAAAGLLRFAHDARVLHRSAALPAEAAPPPADDERALGAMVEADRSLRMARVLAAGGFPEETQPLLVRSLRSVATALAARRGAPPADPSADGAIRSLVEQAALPPEALTILDAAKRGAPPEGKDEVERLIAATTRILASVRRNEPGLAAKAASPA